jgi:hypothetical protein
MASSHQDNMAQFFDFGGISLPQIEGSPSVLTNEMPLQPQQADLLPDLSNAQSTYISNCSVHPFEA